MQYSIDELYDLLIWDNQLSTEENEAKIQQGIAVAMQVKNLYPFVQPVIAPPQNSKLVWQACAKVLAMHSDQELEPYLFRLLEWLQDTNWPGALIIYDRLSHMPYSMLAFPYTHSRKIAELTNDTGWMGALDDLYADLNCKDD